jgi:hypothetical protein
MSLSDRVVEQNTKRVLQESTGVSKKNAVSSLKIEAVYFHGEVR